MKELLPTFVKYIKSSGSDSFKQMTALRGVLEEINGYFKANGPLVHGTQFTAADCVLAPLLYQIEIACYELKVRLCSTDERACGQRAHAAVAPILDRCAFDDLLDCILHSDFQLPRLLSLRHCGLQHYSYACQYAAVHANMQQNAACSLQGHAARRASAMSMTSHVGLPSVRVTCGMIPDRA